MIHKFNDLRFWVKVWCSTYFIVVLKFNVDYPLIASHGEPQLIVLNVSLIKVASIIKVEVEHFISESSIK
jgi:hypothetical protein